MPVNYDEKRDYRRMTISCDVSYKLSGDSRTFSAKGTDLSADGVMFYTETELPLGTKLSIKVHPVIKNILPLTADAEVMRCEKIDNEFEIGVKMMNVS